MASFKDSTFCFLFVSLFACAEFSQIHKQQSESDMNESVKKSVVVLDKKG